MTADLEPAESLALTVARARLSRGENVEANTAAMLVATIERLTGEICGAVNVRPNVPPCGLPAGHAGRHGSAQDAAR